MTEAPPLAAIRIGELAISGLSPVDARRAAAAFESELARLASTGTLAARSPDGALTLKVSASDPRAIGTHAARALHRRLTGAAS